MIKEVSLAKVASKAKNKNEKEKYFNDLDFNNESFIRSDVFATRLQDYIIDMMPLFRFNNLNILNIIKIYKR